MPDNDETPDTAGGIRTGDVAGTVIVGSHNTVNNTVAHMAITAGDGANITVQAGPPPRPVRRGSIAHLPRAAADPLVGREEEARLLGEAVRTHQLVQLWGASGIGKSALLRHLARTLPRGPEGAAYIEAAGRTADDIAQALFDISFDAPGYKPSLEVLKEHIKGLRLRIYLDDTGLGESELLRLFDLAENSVFVFTSQQPCTVRGVHAVRLDGLTAPAAAELVAALLGRELRPDEARTVEALCDVVAGSPLKLRRIASSAANGGRLPGVSDLPALIPALTRGLAPEERDLLHLLGSLYGAELAARHLDDLLGRSDGAALADGLVRQGLLLASETGYSCPPDVAEYVLASRATEFPADQLCRTLTAWARAGDTAPDDVAAHFRALDVAVVRAERSGHPALGVTLARAASPKLALSRQFDAWGSLLGAGWAAARSAGDSEGEAFFLRQARARRRSLSRAALTTALVLETGRLWEELTALHAQSAAHQAAGTALQLPPPVHPVVPVPGTPLAAGHTTAAGHVTSQTAAGHATAAVHAHGAVVRPVFDLSGSGPSLTQPATHTVAGTGTTHAAAGTGTTHAAAGTATHAATGTAAGTGHTALATTGVVGAKGGMTALAVACTVGFVSVLGVSVAAYENSRSDTPSAVPVSRPVPDYDFPPPNADDDDGGMAPVDETTPAVDPVCADVASDLDTELDQFNADAATAQAAVAVYNSDVAAYNAGESYTEPDFSTAGAAYDTVISDLDTIEDTLSSAVAQAEDGSVESDLDSMLTSAQQMEEVIQPFADHEVDQYDTTYQASAMSSALEDLSADCGG